MRLLLSTGIAVAAAFLVSPAPAQTQGVTLEIHPSSIAVSPSYGAVEARAVAKNGLAKPIRQLELSVFNNDGLDIAIGKPTTSGAEPGQSVVWTIKIKNPVHARLPATAQFELKYRQPEQVTCFREFASLAVSSQADSKPVEVSIDGNFDAISQQRPGEGALTITNNLDLPVDIAIKAWPGSASMTIGSVDPFTIPPRSSLHKAVTVNAEGRITPGAYPAKFEVIAHWNWAGGTEERHVVVSKQATLGVFFESELLKALGIPSFLILPGCLVIFTMQLLLAFNIWKLKDESSLPDLSVTTPGFWILSITYSGIFALIWINATNTNYLIRYGLQDLISVWLWSIAIGAALYFGIAGATRERRRLMVPTATDDPIAILQKMARNKMGVVAPEVRFTLNNTTWRGFVAEPLEDGKKLLWVAPPILVRWGDKAPAAIQTAHNEDLALAQNPGKTENPDAIAKRVAERLAGAQTAHQAEVDWDTTRAAATVGTPMHIKTEAITLYLPPARMIT